jgi:hypothetical protein
MAPPGRELSARLRSHLSILYLYGGIDLDVKKLRSRTINAFSALVQVTKKTDESLFPLFLSTIMQEITPYSSYASCEIFLAPALPSNNGEERTRQDIIDHAETAYISRVLVSAQ